MPRILPSLCSLAALLVSASTLAAHPVPKDSHDRSILVRLQKPLHPAGCAGIVALLSGEASLLPAMTASYCDRIRPTNRLQVRVEYRLEVDEWTVYQSDMKPFRDEVNPVGMQAMTFYAKFAEIYAPIYASHFIVRIDKGEPAAFRCVAQNQTLHDENGKGLGHLRCDFVFEATLELPMDRPVTLTIREQNYYLEKGQLVLTMANDAWLAIDSKTVPTEALWKRMRDDMLEPGDDELLREIKLTLAPIPSPAKPQARVVTPIRDDTHPPSRETKHAHDDWFDLRKLVLQTDYGIGLVLLLAFVFGAAHAMTPGHGKTLVAAYLVGERGTVWHALYLGGVTTFTHTGVVMLLALVLTLLPRHLQDQFKAWLENGLSLAMGLIIVCMGFWLLLQRLAGRADHIHVGGGHHHGESSASEPGRRTLGWWGLTLLGITGGMIPCWDAVGILFITVGTSEFWLVLPTVVVFSAGLAVVLVAIGIIIVQVPRFVESRFGAGRIFNALPIGSAILVTAMGLWLCYEGVHGR